MIHRKRKPYFSFHSTSLKQSVIPCFSIIAVFLLFLLLLPFSGHAQQKGSKYDWSLTSTYHYGKIFRHNQAFNAVLIDDAFQFGEIELAAQTKGTELWHQLLNYPEAGVLMIGGSFGNPDFLGYGFGMVPFIKFRIWDTRLMRLFFRLGIGAGAVTNPHDFIDNPRNNAIGSKVNNISQLVFGAEWKLSNHWRLRTAASYTHFSNGRIQRPNKGLNAPAAAVGLRYYFNKTDNFHEVDSIPPIQKRWRFHLSGELAIVETDPLGGPKLPVYVGTGFVSWKTGHTNRLLAGASVEYRTETFDFLVSQEIYDPDERKAKSYNGTLFIGDELLVSDFGISARLGYYVYNPFGVGDDIYSKLGINYYMPLPALGKHTKITIGLNLKAHYGSADYISLGTGFSF